MTDEIRRLMEREEGRLRDLEAASRRVRDAVTGAQDSPSATAAAETSDAIEALEALHLEHAGEYEETARLAREAGATGDLARVAKDCEAEAARRRRYAADMKRFRQMIGAGGGRGPGGGRSG